MCKTRRGIGVQPIARTSTSKSHFIVQAEVKLIIQNHIFPFYFISFLFPFFACPHFSHRKWSGTKSRVIFFENCNSVQMPTLTVAFSCNFQENLPHTHHFVEVLKSQQTKDQIYLNSLLHSVATSMIKDIAGFRGFKNRLETAQINICNDNYTLGTLLKEGFCCRLACAAGRAKHREQHGGGGPQTLNKVKTHPHSRHVA